MCWILITSKKEEIRSRHLTWDKKLWKEYNFLFKNIFEILRQTPLFEYLLALTNGIPKKCIGLYATIDHKEKNTPYIYLSFPNKNRKNHGITQGSVAYTWKNTLTFPHTYWQNWQWSVDTVFLLIYVEKKHGLQFHYKFYCDENVK